MPAERTPIGLYLTHASKAISRAFDDALVAAGGSLPVWLVLLNLKKHSVASQRELAAAMGIKEATLTHHLNTMEKAGLITRRRDPANRRIHVVELTEAGELSFGRLREAASAFDARLRQNVTREEIAALEGALGRLAANVASPDGWPLRAGSAEEEL